ncbi:TAXI family TRAP transporter solute-binding subunit [Desulfovibrio sp. OttesenSCG-928-C14]|nr:TAXI family TRAP transporter solute-binding subunit [Desulfovibrio sp. OttesenSCG-928-C14]
MISCAKTLKTALAALLLILPFSLAPCAEARAQTHDITIAGGGSGGVMSVMAEGFGEVLRRGMPGSRVTTEPGKDGPNQVMVSRNQIPFALGYECVSKRGLMGLPPYKTKLENLRAVGVLCTISGLQFIVDAKTGITSIEQIKERKYPLRVAVNRAGSVMDVAAEALFKSYGFTYKDIESWGGKVMKIPGPETMSLWDAGQVDAIIEISQFPTSRFVELAQKHNLNILSIDPAKQAALNAELGTESIVIAAGTYPFVKEPCPTINTKVLIMTSAEQPDALISGAVQAILDNIKYLHGVHVNLQNLTPEVIAKDILIPLHPAAEKKYREIGVLK